MSPDSKRGDSALFMTKNRQSIRRNVNLLFNGDIAFEICTSHIYPASEPKK